MFADIGVPLSSAEKLTQGPLRQKLSPCLGSQTQSGPEARAWARGLSGAPHPHIYGDAMGPGMLALLGAGAAPPRSDLKKSAWLFVFALRSVLKNNWAAPETALCTRKSKRMRSSVFVSYFSNQV